MRSVLREIGEEEDVDFFKDWLRARYAQTIRPGKKGPENKDFERIGSEFHRWVREQKDQLGLVDEDGFICFVKRDLDIYAKRYGEIRRAAVTLAPGWEAIRYNADRGFTLQTQAMLAPLTPEDPVDVSRRKVALVADFLDIWLARRVWNFRTISYSSVKYTLFQLTKELRDRSVATLSEHLRGQLDEQPESFASAPLFRLHMQNYRQVRHILARLTHWVDTQCGVASHFEDLISEGRARPFEIEHIWADKYERFADRFTHPSDFETERNRIGGLLLLPRLQNETRTELYIDSPEPSQYKALYDALLSRKADIEQAFGGVLLWQRLDDKRACRISASFPGGWVEETTWPKAIEQAVDGMGRLYAALAPIIRGIRGKS